MLRALSARRFVVGFRANVRSHLWHNTGTDDRGRELESCIAAEGMYVVNEEGLPARILMCMSRYAGLRKRGA